MVMAWLMVYPIRDFAKLGRFTLCGCVDRSPNQAAEHDDPNAEPGTRPARISGVGTFSAVLPVPPRPYLTHYYHRRPDHNMSNNNNNNQLQVIYQCELLVHLLLCLTL
jgi:hypothetical protein